MRVLGRLKTVLGIVALTIIMAVVGTTPARAEEVPEVRLQLAPAKVDLENLKPGETKEFELKVQNTGTKKFGYEVSVTPYSVVGEDYKQDFNAETVYTDITKWITLSETEGEVEPDKERIVKVTIKVPQDVPAGGQYATVMVRLKNDPKDSSGNTAITAYQQVGSIIFASIEGDTRRAGSVLENKVPSFMFAPPISGTSVVENTGNVHSNATYILQVSQLFGGEEVYTNEEQPLVVPILPETRRLNTVAWDGAPHLGIFKVKQTVKFLDQTSVTEKIVFICPIWFLFIILAVIFLIIFWIIMHIRGGRE